MPTSDIRELWATLSPSEKGMLSDIADDSYGLFEITQHFRGECPGIPEQDAEALAQEAVRRWIANGWIRLHWSDDILGDQQPLAPDRITDELSDPANWDSMREADERPVIWCQITKEADRFLHSSTVP